jgi:hypothetical protein
VQTKLSFMEDLPVPHLSVWDQLEKEHRDIVMETLARVIAKMITAEQHAGANNDRSQNPSDS